MFSDSVPKINSACYLLSPQEWHSCQVASLKRRPAWTLMLLTTVLWPSRGPWPSPTAVPCRPPLWTRGKERWSTKRLPLRSSSNAPRSDTSTKSPQGRSSLIKLSWNVTHVSSVFSRLTAWLLSASTRIQEVAAPLRSPSMWKTTPTRYLTSTLCCGLLVVL